MATPGPSPEALADLEVPKNARISPTGRHIVYQASPASRKGKHTLSSLWIAEVGKEHSARQITSGQSNDDSPQWSPDGERIAFISDRAKQGESCAVYLLSLQGGEAYPVTKPENKKAISAFKWSSNGHFIAFASSDEKTPEQEAKEKDQDDAKVYGEDWEYNRLRCLHITTREVSTLFAGSAHVNDFAWNDDSTELAYILQRTPEINSPGYHGVHFEKVSLSSRIPTQICAFPGRTNNLNWVGTHLYFLAGAVPDAFCTSKTVYKLSLIQKTWKRHAYGIESCAVELRSAGQAIVVHVQAGLEDHLHVLGREKSSIVYEALHKISTWDVHMDSESSKPVLALGISSGSESTEMVSTEGDKVCRLSQHGTSLAKFEIGEATPIYCKAKDGTGLDGVLLRPSNIDKSKPLPTFLLVHGGPYDRVSIAFDPFYFMWAPYLVSAGYAVLLPNYRGGSSHGDAYAAAAAGAMGTTDYDDIICVLRAAIAQGGIDADRVAIGGWSQGGFLSYLAVTRTDNDAHFRFRGAVCGAGVTDWDTLAITSDAPYFETALSGHMPWASESAAAAAAARHGSALWHMKDVRTPILILHGEDDVRVPFTQAVAFHRGCLHHKIPCEMVAYPREGHMVGERAHFIDMMKRVRRFCDTHLR